MKITNKITKHQKQRLMGKIVKVDAFYKKFKMKNNIIYKKQNIYPQLAWITGFGYINEGSVENDNGSKMFIVSNVISVVKVRFDYKAKEVSIPIDSFELTNQLEYPESKAEIKNRLEMKDMITKRPNLVPRDSKGKFVSLPSN